MHNPVCVKCLYVRVMSSYCQRLVPKAVEISLSDYLTGPPGQLTALTHISWLDWGRLLRKAEKGGGKRGKRGQRREGVTGGKDGKGAEGLSLIHI